VVFYHGVLGLQRWQFFCVLPEERHLPALTKQGLHKTGYGEKQGYDVDDQLSEDNDQETEVLQAAYGLVDNYDGQESGALPYKKSKGLTAVKFHEFTVFSLPQAEKAEKKQIAYRGVPSFMVGEMG
jgi:hypothetical protein